MHRRPLRPTLASWCATTCYSVYRVQKQACIGNTGTIAGSASHRLHSVESCGRQASDRGGSERLIILEGGCDYASKAVQAFPRIRAWVHAASGLGPKACPAAVTQWLPGSRPEAAPQGLTRSAASLALSLTSLATFSPLACSLLRSGRGTERAAVGGQAQGALRANAVACCGCCTAVACCVMHVRPRLPPLLCHNPAAAPTTQRPPPTAHRPRPSAHHPAARPNG